MKNALIVEDSKQIAEIWRTVLINENFQDIRMVENGVNVLTLVKEMNPDIVLMDINLPGDLNGLQLTTGISAMKLGTPVLILTLHDNREILYRAISIGAKGYVVKNSSISEVRKAINALLNGEEYICEIMRKYLN